MRPYILGFGVAPANLSVRLYPMGLVERDKSRGVELLSFRALSIVIPAGLAGAVQGGEGMFDDGCVEWQSVDFNILEVNGVDGFVFEIINGRLEGLVSSATGVH